MKETQRTKQSSKQQATGNWTKGEYIASMTPEAPHIIFDLISSPVLIIQNDEIVYMNRKGWEKFGYCPEDTIGKKVTPLIRKRIEKSSLDAAIEGYSRALSGKPLGRLIIPIIAENGESILVEPKIVLIGYNNQPALLAFLLDPNEQRFYDENWASFPKAVNLAAGDIRNLLQSITNAEYYLRKQLLANEPYFKKIKDLKKMLKVIESAVKRSDQIVRELQNPVERS